MKSGTCPSCKSRRIATRPTALLGTGTAGDPMLSGSSYLDLYVCAECQRAELFFRGEERGLLDGFPWKWLNPADDGPFR